MSVTPHSLLQRLRTPGDAKAWDRFVEVYTPLLFFWVRRAGLQDCDASDVVQDVFAVLVRKLPDFEYDAGKGFRKWLRTVTLNRCRDFFRKKAATLAQANAAALEAIEAPPDDEPFWETEYRQFLVRRLLELMQAEFQPSTWQACWKSTVEGRSAADVARELNLTEGAVRAAKFRVLSRLRGELEGLLD